MLKKPYNIPITDAQREYLARAATLLQERRQERVTLGAAIREWALDGAKRVLEDTEQVA